MVQSGTSPTVTTIASYLCKTKSICAFLWIFRLPRIFMRRDVKRKEKRKNMPATVELSSSKTQMTCQWVLRRPGQWSSEQLAAWDDGRCVKGVWVPRADFLLWANEPRQLVTHCTRQLQELIWPWMQLWPPCGLSQWNGLFECVFLSVHVCPDSFHILHQYMCF